MGKHTPGPWIVEQSAKTPIYVSPLDRQEEISICHVLVIDDDEQGDDGEWFNGDQTKANASLIAAAPDMLAALEKIAKLKWRDNLRGLDKPTDFADRQAALFALGDAQSIARAAIAKAKGV